LEAGQHPHHDEPQSCGIAPKRLHKCYVIHKHSSRTTARTQGAFLRPRPQRFTLPSAQRKPQER
jgi:hypothetical protein